jgi:hypothetical protein
MAILALNVLALFVLHATTTYPGFVPTIEELSGHLLLRDIDSETVIVCTYQDCPLCAQAVCLGGISRSLINNVGIHQIGRIVTRSGLGRIGRSNVEIARKQPAMELE